MTDGRRARGGAGGRGGRPRGDGPLDVLRDLGYAVGWSSSPMDAAFVMAGKAVVIDGTRPREEREAAAEWAWELAIDELHATA